MQIQTLQERLTIAVSSRQELDQALNNAMDILKPAAQVKRVGIEVTRTDVGRYTMCLSRTTPYGTTVQRWGQ